MFSNTKKSIEFYLKYCDEEIDFTLTRSDSWIFLKKLILQTSFRKENHYQQIFNKNS